MDWLAFAFEQAGHRERAIGFGKGAVNLFEEIEDSFGRALSLMQLQCLDPTLVRPFDDPEETLADLGLDPAKFRKGTWPSATSAALG